MEFKKCLKLVTVHFLVAVFLVVVKNLNSEGNVILLLLLERVAEVAAEVAVKVAVEVV